MEWTKERVELLRSLWLQGLSARQVAAKIGGVTRNAVIGKVHRLGLSGRAAPARHATAPAHRAAGHNCLWPLGDPKDPGFRFCGEPTVPGRPYCVTHSAIAYNRRADAAA